MGSSKKRSRDRKSSKKRSRERDSSPHLRRKIQRLERQLADARRAELTSDVTTPEHDKENHPQNRGGASSPKERILRQAANLSTTQESSALSSEIPAARQGTSPQSKILSVEQNSDPSQSEILSVEQNSVTAQPDNLSEKGSVEEVSVSETASLPEISEETQVSEKKTLDDDTRRALGEDPANTQKRELTLHSELVAIWATWISAGLSKEAIAELLDKYPRKGNLNLEAPELNPEIAVILNESGTKRDNLFIQEQNYAASGMSALGQAISMIINDEEEPIDRLKLLQNLGDAGKLFAQLHFQISSARKAYIAPVLTKQTKELLQKTSPSSLLYGDNLSEIVKTARSTEKLGKDLKYQAPSSSTNIPKKSPPQTAHRSLNWRGSFPRRGTSYQSQRGGHQKTTFSKNWRYNNQPQNNWASQNKGSVPRGGKQ